jgi:hypothetical protein
VIPFGRGLLGGALAAARKPTSKEYAEALEAVRAEHDVELWAAFFSSGLEAMRAVKKRREAEAGARRRFSKRMDRED